MTGRSLTQCYIISILKKSHLTEKEPYAVITISIAIKHQAVVNFLLVTRISEASPYFAACDWYRKSSGPRWAPTPSPLKGHMDPQAAAFGIMKTASLWICVFGKDWASSASWWVLRCVVRVILGRYVGEVTNRVIVQLSSFSIVWRPLGSWLERIVNKAKFSPPSISAKT